MKTYANLLGIMNINHIKNKTELGLYLTGLLAADGNFIRSKVNKSKLLGVEIGLAETDRNILYLFDNCFNKQFNHYKRVRLNQQNFYRINIRSQELCKELLSLGLTVKKSYNLQFPSDLKSSQLKHYLRGMFDGDGYIGVQPQLACKSAYFVKGFLDFISKEFKIHPKYNDKRGIITFKVESKEFFKWLYFDSNYYFKRKLDKVIDYVN